MLKNDAETTNLFIGNILLVILAMGAWQCSRTRPSIPKNTTIHNNARSIEKPNKNQKETRTKEKIEPKNQEVETDSQLGWILSSYDKNKAAEIHPTEVLRSDFPNDGASFGVSVSLYGTDVLVGESSIASGNIGLEGKVYLFSKNNNCENCWGLSKVFSSPEDSYRKGFGAHVSMSNNTLAVSSYTRSTGNYKGVVFIWGRSSIGSDSWKLLKKIESDLSTSDNVFATSILLNEDWLFVGDVKRRQNEQNDGAVFVYHRDYGGSNNWGLVKIIDTLTKASNPYFGTSLAYANDTLIVGAPSEMSGGEPNGVVYIFGRNFGGENNWGLEATLEANNGHHKLGFGRAIAISRDTIVVGASAYSEEMNEQGAVYVFSRSKSRPEKWDLLQTIVHSQAYEDELFGNSVAISNERILIGTGSDSEDGWSGAYLYAKPEEKDQQFKKVANLRPKIKNEEDGFGYDVALYNDMAIVGSAFYPLSDIDSKYPASGADEGIIRQGAVFLYDLKNPVFSTTSQ